MPVSTGHWLSPVAGWLAVSTCALVAFSYLAIGLWAVASPGLTEIHADQWRRYPLFVERGFPQNILASDNGHRTVFTAAIRLVELTWMSGRQALQLAAGALFAVGALSEVSWIALRDHMRSMPWRAAAVALFAFGLFWLGNARMLLPGNVRHVSAGLALVMRAGLRARYKPGS